MSSNTEPDAQMETYKRQISRLTEIGIALSAELDLDALLEKTLQYARELTFADAGTLYLMAGDTLHFKIMQNESMKAFLGGTTGKPINLEPVKLEKTNVSAYAALLKTTVNIPDVYASSEFDFSGPRRYDQKTGYHSRSMLVVPMKTHDGEVIGVLQLINALDPFTKAIIPFSKASTQLTQALASQAAVAITNANLVKEIKDLFESLVRVLAIAIDQKSPYTGNHVQRVAEFNVMLAKAVNAKGDGAFSNTKFSPDQLEEIRLAGWLHDVGKVTTPVHVMDKATKLEAIFDRIGLIEERFSAFRASLQAQAQEEKVALALTETDTARRDEGVAKIETKLAGELGVLEDDLAFLRRCNQPGEFMEDAKLKRLNEIAQKTYRVEGKDKPCLTGDETLNLSIRRGTLTEEQFKIMRDHVVMTEKMLTQIPFAGKLKNVPTYAAEHHEKLNGKGYP
ncbi:MAG: GAF domain-containing protein, partial [Candidatus Sumerlaeota bacterium]|nr:GAF domain-containing protein [Candidatus Sumerlaeota bacterium]